MIRVDYLRDKDHRYDGRLFHKTNQRIQVFMNQLCYANDDFEKVKVRRALASAENLKMISSLLSKPIR